MSRAGHFRSNALAATAAALMLVLPASAQAFGGPWNSSAQPPTITTPGIVAEVDPYATAGLQQFQVLIGPGVSCPNGTPVPVQVTFQDAQGSVSDSFADPCAQTWPNNGNSDPNLSNFQTVTLPGDPTLVYGFDPTGVSPSWQVGWAQVTMSPMWNGTMPFMFTVTGSGGRVLAQGAWSGTVDNTTGSQTIDEDSQPDSFWNVCIDGSYTILSENGGDLYCTVTTGSDTTTLHQGWPPPPPPPPPWRLPRATALRLMKLAPRKVSHSPRRITLTGCTRTNDITWQCRASWRTADYTYAGTVEVWVKSATARYWYYSMNVKRTQLDCVRRCTRHIVVA